jgi:cyanophycin synthetase
VLNHPRVEVAVLETARGGILRKGLGFDRCSVGVVTNISPDHIGQGGIDTVEDLARVKRVVIESVARDGTAVLNADDPLVAEMRSAHDGKKVYFSVEPVNNPLVREHLARGGTCVLVEDGRIVIATGTRRSPVAELEHVPFTHGGRFGFQVQNALAATAAAWASGLSVGVIAETLRRFDTTSSLVPGRFNMMELFGRELIVDYGHNSGAMHAMGQAVGALELRRTLMVLGLPGDRRNEELVATALAAVPFVDEFVLYDLADLRERAPGEVPRLLASELPHYTPREYATNEKEALLAALKTSRPGDRIILISDIVDQTLETIELLQWTEPPAPQPAEDEAGARPV